jgi:hypothetical protein
MVQEAGSVYYKVGADTSGLEKGLKSSGEKVGALEGTFKKLAAGIIGALTIRAVFNFGKEILAAAAEEEAAFAGLQQSIENTGAAYADAEGAVKSYIKQQMKTTAFGEEEQVKAIQALTEITGDYSQALDLATLAEDLAAAKGMDLTTAAELVGKVAKGNTGMLARYGIVIDKDADATQALAIMSQKFSGQAAKMGQTGAGAMKRFSNQVGELKDTLGRALLPAIGQVAGKLADFISDNLPGIEELVTKVGTWLAGAFESVWNWVGKAIDFGKQFVDVMGAVFGDIADGDLGLAVDDFFEGFFKKLTEMGINVPVAKAFVNDLVKIFQDIAPEVEDAASAVGRFVSDLFSGKGVSGWFDKGPGVEMANGIAQIGANGAPGLKTTFTTLGKTILGYIGEGLLSGTTSLNDMADKFTEWANGDGKTKAEEIGHTIAQFVTDGIKALFDLPGTSDETSQKITNMLNSAITKMDVSVYSLIGTSLATAITDMFTNAFGGKEFTASIVKSLEDLFANLFTLISPLRLGAIILSKIKEAIAGATYGQNPPTIGNPYTPSPGNPIPGYGGVQGSSYNAGGITVNVSSPNPSAAGNAVVAALRRKGYA